MRAFRIPNGAKPVTDTSIQVESVLSVKPEVVSIKPEVVKQVVSTSLLPMKRPPEAPDLVKTDVVKSEVKPIAAPIEFDNPISCVLHKTRKNPLFQDRVMTTLKSIFAKPRYILLLVGPSGHGKSHCLEAVEANWICDVDVDEDESESAAFEKLLDMSLRRNPLKKQRVAVHCIEALDTSQKKLLSSFLKKNKEHPSIQLVLTSDSLFEAPTNTLRKDSSVQVLTMNEQSSSHLNQIVIEQAKDTLGMTVSEKAVSNLCEHARGNPRAAIQAFDFAARTRKGTSSKFESDRDCPMDIFKQVPSVVHGKPLRMDLESSDLFFATMLCFENSTIHRDHFGLLDIVSKKYLLDSAATQNFLELPFKTQSQWLEGRMRMQGPSKKKPIRDAAHWPNDADHPLARPSEMESHDRLKVLNAYLAKEKTLLKKNPMYHEDADIREIRKKGLFL